MMYKMINDFNILLIRIIICDDSCVLYVHNQSSHAVDMCKRASGHVRTINVIL